MSYKLLKHKNLKLSREDAQLTFRVSVEYSSSIRVEIGDQVLYIGVEPDYRDNPKIFINLGED